MKRHATALSLFAGLLLIFTASPALGQDLAINEFLADPNPGVDLNNDGSSTSADEFVEILNTGPSSINIGGYMLDDELDPAGTSAYEFPAGTTLDPGEAAVVIGDAMGVNLPGFTGSGLPGLNNTGDTINLIDDQGAVVASYTFSDSEGDNGVSAARNRNQTGNPFQPQTDFGTAEAQSAGFDNNDGSALPVEFESAPTATVSGDAVTLHWTTLTETNNLGFRVQHRRTGQDESNWNTADERVAGAGNSATANDYDYTVRGLTPGTYEFRVRQVDTDDTKSFSEIVEATVRADDFALLAPTRNPFQARTELRYTTVAAPQQNVEAALYNSLGQKVRTLRPTGGRIAIEAGSLASGVYFVRLTNGERVDTQSITLVR